MTLAMSLKAYEFIANVNYSGGYTACSLCNLHCYSNFGDRSYK